MKTWITKSKYAITRVLNGRSNVYLVSCHDKNIFVDTGVDSNCICLYKRLRQMNVSPLDYLIITHTHYDHVANAAKIKKEYAPCVMLQKNESFYLENGKNKFPFGTNVASQFLIKTLGRIVSPIFDFPSCSPNILIDNHYTFQSSNLNVYIINTPGHSDGSCSVIIDDEFAVVGDAMFGVFKDSIFLPFADDIKQMIISWRKLLDTRCTLFLPGHGNEIPRALVQNEYDARIV